MQLGARSTPGWQYSSGNRDLYCYYMIYHDQDNAGELVIVANVRTNIVTVASDDLLLRCNDSESSSNKSLTIIVSRSKALLPH